MLHYLDWREASAELVEPLYAAECGRWERALGWDYRPACALIEDARCAGRLPGVIAFDEGREAVGWAYYMMHGGRLQIGALLARSRPVVSALLGKILRSPDARGAEGVSCFLYPAVSGVPRLLARRGFTVFPHRYRRLRLDGACPAARPACAGYGGGRWSDHSLPDIARLFASAYEGMPESRCFTVGNRMDEWVVYLAHLHGGAICGRLNPELSAVTCGAGGQLAAALVATDLAGGTAHIAQVAVSPAHRGHRLGEDLVRRCCARAGEAGYRSVTLLVADSNVVARRIYDRLGFDETEEFVFGYRDQVR